MSPQSPIGLIRTNLGRGAETTCTQRCPPTLAPLKLTIAAILLTALGLAVAVARSGHASGADLAMLAVAILSVCTFGAIPVLLGARRKKSGLTRKIVLPPRDPPAPDS